MLVAQPVVSQLTRILPCLLVVPVRVPVRGCARVLPLKHYEGYARVVPTQPDPSPVPVGAHANCEGVTGLSPPPWRVAVGVTCRRQPPDN